MNPGRTNARSPLAAAAHVPVARINAGVAPVRSAVSKPALSKPLNPVAAARAEDRRRIADVFASKAVIGREMTAALLLSETTMRAAAIVKMLGGVDASPSAQDQARQSIIDAANDRKGCGPAQNYGWAKIHADIRDERSN
jgi:hypothetical protein